MTHGWRTVTEILVAVAGFGTGASFALLVNHFWPRRTAHCRKE
jgi:hypothetical protein